MTHRTKPTITVPEGTPPTELLIEDIEVGDGPEATPGSTPVMHYVGVSWSTGKEFDASWNRNDTFSFALGRGQVIGGWDQGVAGMRVGGRRRLTIPRISDTAPVAPAASSHRTKRWCSWSTWST